MHEVFGIKRKCVKWLFNMHGQLPNEARCPNFDLSLYLHPFYVCESSEGSRDIAPKHIQ